MIKRFLRKIFGVHSPSKEWYKVGHIEYQEKDTKCDLCDRKSECELMDVTRLTDTRTHVINAFGFSCPLENDIPEQYKTCGRCIHDCESTDIVGSTCYMCKRNPDDNRIDWFEKKKEN